VKTGKLFWWVAGGAALLLIFTAMDPFKILSTFLPSVEGFSSRPYWDHKQWSWGYGTKVPGSSSSSNVPPGNVTITREQAFRDTMSHVQTDYNYLRPLVSAPLKPQQWAALLSFSYNEGPANADNLMVHLNAQDWPALETQWKKYIYASGVVNAALVDRRDKEWKLFTS
jgi:GH24 family phage-related lysozyme (muramidase)